MTGLKTEFPVYNAVARQERAGHLTCCCSSTRKRSQWNVGRNLVVNLHVKIPQLFVFRTLYGYISGPQKRAYESFALSRMRMRVVCQAQGLFGASGDAAPCLGRMSISRNSVLRVFECIRIRCEGIDDDMSPASR